MNKKNLFLTVFFSLLAVLFIAGFSKNIVGVSIIGTGDDDIGGGSSCATYCHNSSFSFLKYYNKTTGICQSIGFVECRYGCDFNTGYCKSLTTSSTEATGYLYFTVFNGYLYPSRLSGANITLDGNSVGLTNVTGELIVSVTVGNYYISISKSGFQTVNYNTYVGPRTNWNYISLYEYISCTDSDGGMNPSVKGTVQIEGLTSGNVFRSATDFCNTTKIITEFSCISSQPTYPGFQEQSQNCPYRCFDGACIPRGGGKISPSPESTNWIIWVIAIIAIILLIMWWSKKNKKK